MGLQKTVQDDAVPGGAGKKPFFLAILRFAGAFA